MVNKPLTLKIFFFVLNYDLPPYMGLPILAQKYCIAVKTVSNRIKTFRNELFIFRILHIPKQLFFAS
jgi:hypothetical protein